MSESQRKPRLSTVLKLIREGHYDKNLSEIEMGVGERRTAILDEVEKLVKDTLGDHYIITTVQPKQREPRFPLGPFKSVEDGGIKLRDDPGVPEGQATEVFRAPKLSLDEDPLSAEDESRSPMFGSIPDDELTPPEVGDPAPDWPNYEQQETTTEGENDVRTDSLKL